METANSTIAAATISAIAKPTRLALTVEEPALRPHNFRVRLISQSLGAYLVVAGRRWPCEATRLAGPVS